MALLDRRCRSALAPLLEQYVLSVGNIFIRGPGVGRTHQSQFSYFSFFGGIPKIFGLVYVKTSTGSISDPSSSIVQTDGGCRGLKS